MQRGQLALEGILLAEMVGLQPCVEDGVALIRLRVAHAPE
jgi:hypothetical protein